MLIRKRSINLSYALRNSISNNSESIFCLHAVKSQTVIFQAIQFSISAQFKCQTFLSDLYIRPYHVLELPARIDLGAMIMIGTPHFTMVQHYWCFIIRLVSCVICRALGGGVLTLCWDAVGIFCSASWMGCMTLVGRILPLCIDAVGVFCSPSRLSNRTLVRGALPFCRDDIGILCCPSWLDQKTLVGRVLTFCRDAVGVTCSTSTLAIGHSLGECYASAEM